MVAAAGKTRAHPRAHPIGCVAVRPRRAVGASGKQRLPFGARIGLQAYRAHVNDLASKSFHAKEEVLHPKIADLLLPMQG